MKCRIIVDSQKAVGDDVSNYSGQSEICLRWNYRQQQKRIVKKENEKISLEVVQGLVLVVKSVCSLMY